MRAASTLCTRYALGGVDQPIKEIHYRFFSFGKFSWWQHKLNINFILFVRHLHIFIIHCVVLTRMWHACYDILIYCHDLVMTYAYSNFLDWNSLNFKKKNDRKFIDLLFPTITTLMKSIHFTYLSREKSLTMLVKLRWVLWLESTHANTIYHDVHNLNS